MIDGYRRNTHRRLVPVEEMYDDLLTDEEQEPELAFLHWEEAAQLRTVLQTLPPLQQRILQLRFVNELRSPDIAAQVGKSETAVRAILSRTLNLLRRQYREGEDEQ